MIRFDRGALICDFAETYRIYDIWSLPARLVATYAVGLRDNSRIKMKISGVKAPNDTILLAQILDTVRWLQWTKTKDGQKNRNRPDSVAEQMIVKEKPEEGRKKGISFETSDDFERARQRLLQRIIYGERGDFE